MKQYYSILAIMVIAVITYSPDVQAESKIKGLIGFSSFATSYTDTDPTFEDDPTEFKFGVGTGTGFVSDYFLDGKQKTAFAVDMYLLSSSASGNAHPIEIGDPPNRYGCPNNRRCPTTLSQTATLISVMLGYRYHFGGYDDSTGYLGIGALIGHLGGGQIRDTEIPDSGSSIVVGSNPSGINVEPGGPKGGIGISPALSGGYDWKLTGDKNSRRNTPVVMGIHLMYSPATKYGEVSGVDIITLGYTVGGIIGSN